MSLITIFSMISMLIVAYYFLFRSGPGLFGSVGPVTAKPSGPVQFTFNAVGDISQNAETGKNLASNNPNLILIAGDFGYQQDPQEWWSKVMTPINGKDVIAALGNHDNGSKYLSINAFKQTSWSFNRKVGPITFVVVDTETNNINEIGQRLSQAQADPTCKMIVILQHKTVFIPESVSLKPDAPLSLHQLYVKYSKVKLVLGGHNHFYARLKPVQGILYVTIGHGGRNNSSGSASPATLSRINGVLKCNVSADATISCQNVANTGQILDTFVVSPTTLPTGGEEVTVRSGISDDTGIGNNEDMPKDKSSNRAVMRSAHAKLLRSAGLYYN